MPRLCELSGTFTINLTAAISGSLLITDSEPGFRAATAASEVAETAQSLVQNRHHFNPHFFSIEFCFLVDPKSTKKKVIRSKIR